MIYTPVEILLLFDIKIARKSRPHHPVIVEEEPNYLLQFCLQSNYFKNQTFDISKLQFLLAVGFMDLICK
jgi:hypothetical protein